MKVYLTSFFPNFKGIIYTNTSDFDGIAEDPLSHHTLYMDDNTVREKYFSLDRK